MEDWLRQFLACGFTDVADDDVDELGLPTESDPEDLARAFHAARDDGSAELAI